MIAFAFPWALLTLPLPLLVWYLAAPRHDRTPGLRIPFFQEIVDAGGAQPRAGAAILSRGRLQMIIAVIVWCFLVLALARPERVGEPVEIVKAARDVALAIDISGSMDDRDFAGIDGERLQRLDAVKRVVSRFVEDRAGDRVALIVFGTRAFVQAPFTEDLETVTELLDQTKVGMAGPHTAIGDAIGLAIRTFEAREIDQRLMILLSDGADTGSRMSPVNAAEIAARMGIGIFTIGVGDPEAGGEGRVDLATLKDIAARAGGRFFFAADEAALSTVYDRIDEMTPRSIETLSHRPRQPLGGMLLGAAALLIVLALAWLHGRALWRART